MTGLQKAVEHGQASTFEDQKLSHSGFPFDKIVYVGDLSGAASYGLRYAQQLAQLRNASRGAGWWCSTARNAARSSNAACA
jgi:hypothetical protein